MILIVQIIVGVSFGIVFGFYLKKILTKNNIDNFLEKHTFPLFVIPISYFLIGHIYEDLLIEGASRLQAQEGGATGWFVAGIIIQAVFLYWLTVLLGKALIYTFQIIGIDKDSDLFKHCLYGLVYASLIFCIYKALQWFGVKGGLLDGLFFLIPLFLLILRFLSMKWLNHKRGSS